MVNSPVYQEKLLWCNPRLAMGTSTPLSGMSDRRCGGGAVLRNERVNCSSVSDAMKRTIGVAEAVALSMGITTSVASAAQPTLSSELLRVSQMPTGWSVNNSSLGTGVGCLTNYLEPKGIGQTSHASVFFAGN